MKDNRNNVMLGKKDTGMSFVLGGLECEVSPSAFDCYIADVQIDVPPDVDRVVKAIEAIETEKALRNESHAWNGLIPHLNSISWHNIGSEQRLRLNFILAHYFHFMATHVRPLILSDGLDYSKTNGISAQVVDWDFRREPAPGVVNAIPLNLAILTADQQLVFSRRSDSLAIAPGVVACAVNENLDPVLDRIDHNRLSIQKLVDRAMLEEVGLDSGEWTLCLRGLAVCRKTLSYSLLGHARVEMPFDALVKSCSQNARDRFEIDHLICVPFATQELCRFIHQHNLYNCAGVAAAGAFCSSPDRSKELNTQFRNVQEVRH